MIGKLFGCLRAPAVVDPVPPQNEPQPQPQPQMVDGYDPPMAHAAPAADMQATPTAVTPSLPQRAAEVGPEAAPLNSPRLLRAMKNFKRTKQTVPWCDIAPREDNFYIWDTTFFFASGPMAVSLRKKKLSSVKLKVVFPPDYPRAAPSVRVVSPRIGPVNDQRGSVFGGALCLDILHRWNPATLEESMLAAVHAAVATAKVTSTRSYSQQAYEEGVKYIRRVHKDWGTPDVVARAD